jgi:hypothetical protein
MKRLTLCLALIFLLISAISAQEQKEYEFRGVLKDKNLAVLTGVPLFFKKDDGKETSVSTDINGEFSIKLLPGSYEVTVRKTLSEKFIAFISIAENRVNPNDVEFRIETNPVCYETLTKKPCPQVLNAVKPPYPAAAQAVRASGEVVVRAKIDKKGKVISSSAIIGHPLLKTVSVKAANGFLFETSENEEVREVIITFVFFLPQDEKENLKRFSSPYRIEIVVSISGGLLTNPIIN